MKDTDGACRTISHEVEDAYTRILRLELIPAAGCTEPIAIALAGAKMIEALGEFPQHIDVRCSGNIIKNAKSVVVPGSGGLKGIQTAAILGALSGEPGKGLEVLREQDAEKLDELNKYLGMDICTVSLLETKEKLHIVLRGTVGERFAEVEIRHTHDGIVRVETEKGILYKAKGQVADNFNEEDYDLLNTKDIYAFATRTNIDPLRSILDTQIEYNMRISQEGLEKDYGACVGMTIIAQGKDVSTIAKAAAAAGSDARMSGCELPVVINSGSGNQGLTASIPVVIYAKQLGVSKERLYRALLISNLLSIEEKYRIGRLSAFCGAVSAAAGAGAGIAYLKGADEAQIMQTVVNTLANTSGIFCDGAKPSCAAKIATCLDAALLSMDMAMSGRGFSQGDGLVKSTLDRTVVCLSEVVHEGMGVLDEVILKEMLVSE